LAFVIGQEHRPGSQVELYAIADIDQAARSESILDLSSTYDEVVGAERTGEIDDAER
jgi:hypothetical protein